ncbi:unnamed protein product [Rotaria sp. Silwood2]|nr:unnamed protein product [Rotaria sp. Silwood2]
MELQIIRENIGQLIFLNSFISTSLEYEMATAFSLSGDPSGEHILFHITVDKTIINPKPFADISTVSQFVEEKEVLFMAGSIFEIKNVTFCESSHVWIIKLHLCNDNAYELNDVYQEDKTIVSDQKSPFSLAAALLRMNLFDKAEKYYQQLLDNGSVIDISSSDLTIHCFWRLINVARNRGDFDIAFAYSRLAIEQSPDRPELLYRSHKYISLNYLEIHSISEALEYQMKALEIQQNINDTKDQFADTLFNIGFIYFSQIIPNIDSALDYFFQALNIYKEWNTYDEIIRCLNAIDEIYLNKKQKELALNYFLQALQVIDEHFPSYLPYRFNSFEHIAETYASMHDYIQAMKYYDDALNAKLK